MDSFLVVGLGNPGARYANSRHNAGTDFVLALAKKYETKLVEKKNIKSQVAELYIKKYKVYLAIPEVFMNHSGISVKLLKSKYNIDDKNILIVHDDLDLKIGTCKLKQSGGHGGHNGLKSIINETGSSAFKRMRIGIGHPGDKKKVNSYVIKKGNKEERQFRANAVLKGLEVIDYIFEINWELALNKLHKK